MSPRSLSAKHIIIIVLLIMHLLPIWLFKYFPTQDGSSHVYNAYVLKDYHKHENYRLREVYKLNLTIFPNWASHIILALLMYIFPPIICEKILVSICITFLPISLFYFLNGVRRGKAFLGLIGFIYAYNYLLHMGFYNFTLSIPLFFFALGYWWRRKDKIGPTNIAVLYILLICTYFCHYQSYSLLVLSLTFFAGFSSLYKAFQKTWGYKNISLDNGRTLLSKLKTFAMELKPALLFVGSMLPAYFIMMSYYLAKTRGYGRTYKTLEELKSYFFSMKSLVAFKDDHILIGRILLIILAIAFLLTLWDKIREVYRFHKSPKSNSLNERLWIKVVDPKIQFLLMSAILTVMYFKMPYYIHSGGAWINDRIHIYIFLVLLPFFNISLHRYARYVISVAIIILSLWNLGYNSQTYYHLSKDIENMVSSESMFGEHAILDSRPSEWGGPSDSFGQPKYVAPFLHLECYLGLENGMAYLKNYEAEHDYFPIIYRDRNIPAEYIVVWRTEYDEAGNLADGYDLIHSSSYNRLYRRKKAKPDDNLWGGRKVLDFDMQPHNGQTTPGHIPIFSDTIYVDGKYGWVTRSDRNEFRNEIDIPEPYRDIIWSETDGVFRIALPNGEYEIICYFCSAGSEAQEINIIANGEKKIKKLKIPGGNETSERSYIINVTDERLTQVIYTRGKGQYKRWGWSGFSIRRRH